VLLALLLCLLPVAIVVQRNVAPAPPPTLAVEEAAPVEADATAQAATAPAPTPAAAPVTTPGAKRELIKLPPIVLNKGNRANETAAIATSRNAMSAQAQFQASSSVDEDNDGTGEFATFAEMSGAIPLRGGTRHMNPPVLSGAFKTVDAAGRITRSGYVYAIFLPQPGGWGCAEQGYGGLNAGVVDPDLAETTWCMYAWPVKYGVTGKRTFMANQTGDVLATDDARYSGANGPQAGAAFARDSGGASTITGKTAIGAKSNDGNLWKQVN
jgi:Protein of unknown function (DUF2950)